tara:strand:- start:23 stop:229 length:207 start_codon:yes stop_codon:yes gene_type:complete
MSKKSNPQIVVGFRRKDELEKEFGPEIYFSINKMGIAEALDVAQEYMQQQSSRFKNLEYKIWGCDWEK